VTLKVQPSERVRQIPPYLFAEIDRKKRELRAKGVDLIDLGIGDPDIPTPSRIIDRLTKAAQDATNHRYPSYEGMLDFRQAVADWYQRRFGVSLDPETEVLTLIGSKEGIAHTPLAFVDPGDYVLVPNPGYPVYRVATLFAGGIPHFMPLVGENGFLPDFSKIPTGVAENAKLLFINYPNNPTAAVAERPFFEDVVKFADRHGIIVCHDAAYSEIAFDGYRPMSLMEVEGAREVGIEFHSLSKTFNMTGWRIGFAVGNREIVGALGKIKTNIDSGVFQAVQIAAAEALNGYGAETEEIVRVYTARRDLLVQAIRAAGLEVEPPRATFYLWVAVPSGYTSAQFAAHLMEKSGIVATPGIGFGDSGEGYVRFALTVGEDRLRETASRLKKLKV
jgi:LL-diaminopimelate aminotransferase